MSVKSVSFTDIAVGDAPTHIIIYRDSEKPDSKSSDLEKKVVELLAQVEAMSKRILQLELAAEPNVTPFFGASIAPEPTGLVVRRLSDVGDDSKSTFKAIIGGLVPPPNATRLPDVEETNTEEEEEEEEEEAEAEEEEEAEAEEEEEAEAEAEAEQLSPFDYKGVTYYKDSENLVYRIDDDGDLDDTPIGVWNEEKQKVLKIKQ